MYCLRESDMMDLISEGSIGLVRAIEMFRANHKSGASFATYAIFHIDQKISRFVRMNKFMHIPENFLQLRKKFDELEFRGEGNLTNRDLRKELDISQEELERLRDSRSRSVLYLEDIFCDKEGRNWVETLKDESVPSPYKENCIKSLRDFLDKYIGLLSDREAQILKCIHYSDKNMTLDEISKIVHVSRERVRQIYHTTLRKLRIYIIKGLDVEKHKENNKHIHYGRRGSWRYTNKTPEEQEMSIKNIMENLSIL